MEVTFNAYNRTHPKFFNFHYLLMSVFYSKRYTIFSKKSNFKMTIITLGISYMLNIFSYLLYHKSQVVISNLCTGPQHG